MRIPAVLATLVVAGLLAVVGAVFLAPAPVPIPQAANLTASLPTPASTQPATGSSPLRLPVAQRSLDGAKSSERPEVEIVEPVLPVLRLARTAAPGARQVPAAIATTTRATTTEPSDGASSGDHSSGKDG